MSEVPDKHYRSPKAFLPPTGAHRIAPIRALVDTRRSVKAEPTPERQRRSCRSEHVEQDQARSGKRASAKAGRASIQTTADIYTDWDIEQLAETMRDVLAQDER